MRGKIGRSFIGQLLSRGGYEVVFIDADLKLIEELNRRGHYNVIIKAAEGRNSAYRKCQGSFSI